MRLRMELFVVDIEASVAFYTGVLGFRADRGGGDYVSLRRGSAVLGLGDVAKLPAHRAGAGPRGAGVEIVLELDDPAQVTALHEHCRTRAVVTESLRRRPWGLLDFRVTDPDGYYLRITHGAAAAVG